MNCLVIHVGGRSQIRIDELADARSSEKETTAQAHGVSNLSASMQLAAAHDHTWISTAYIRSILSIVSPLVILPVGETNQLCGRFFCKIFREQSGLCCFPIIDRCVLVIALSASMQHRVLLCSLRRQCSMTVRRAHIPAAVDALEQDEGATARLESSGHYEDRSGQDREWNGRIRQGGTNKQVC
jgi:hypothetical protein